MVVVFFHKVGARGGLRIKEYVHVELVPHPKATKSNSSRNHPLRRSTRRSSRPSVTQAYHHQRGSEWPGQAGRIGTAKCGRRVPRSWLELPIGPWIDGATYAILMPPR